MLNSQLWHEPEWCIASCWCQENVLRWPEELGWVPEFPARRAFQAGPCAACEQRLVFEPRVVATSGPMQMGPLDFFLSSWCWFEWEEMWMWLLGMKDAYTDLNKQIKSLVFHPQLLESYVDWKTGARFLPVRKTLLTSLLFMVKAPNLPEEMYSSQKIKTSFFLEARWWWCHLLMKMNR